MLSNAGYMQHKEEPKHGLPVLQQSACPWLSSA